MPQDRLPTDPFDLALSRLIGLPGGAHTQPSVVQDVDFYGNTTQFIVQTVSTEDGPYSFITQVNAQGRERFVLPPAVIRLVDRQRDSTTTQKRRRAGKRNAEERKARGEVPGFLATRHERKS